jgi:citrate lyase subunit beta/citryl-CoA lyase
MSTGNPVGQARGFLFVPGNRPVLLLKALQSDADVIILDLEEAVPPAVLIPMARAAGTAKVLN